MLVHVPGNGSGFGRGAILSVSCVRLGWTGLTPSSFFIHLLAKGAGGHGILLFETFVEMGGVLESPVKSDVGDFSVFHVGVQQVSRTEIQALAKNVLLDRIIVWVSIE